MKFGLTEDSIEKINTVFKKHGEVEQVYIYGSRAIGNFRNGSDIDLTLKGNNLSATILFQICSEIDDLNTPYLFDISIFENIQSFSLIDHINRIGQVFYKKEF